LAFPKVCLWGFQHFAPALPLGTVLVWNKKRPNQLGTFLSDCELAWVKGGKGVYLFNHVWHGFDRETERGKTKHPTQKPVALFAWVFKRMKLKAGDLIFDPFMGSGPIAQAAQDAGLRYVGCEIVPQYFETAVGRFGL
jgi:site-specific DNA-methyltransferase (adenine-specific)